MNERRKIFIGSEIIKDREVSFRVYSPKRKEIFVVIIYSRGYSPGLELAEVLRCRLKIDSLKSKTE
jgi:hypothetical protein